MARPKKIEKTTIRVVKLKGQKSTQQHEITFFAENPEIFAAYKNHEIFEIPIDQFNKIKGIISEEDYNTLRQENG